MHANPYRPNLLELGVLLFWPPPPWDDTKRHFTQFITTHSTADAEGIAVKFIANFWKGSCNSLVLIYTNPVVSRYHLGWKAVNRAFLRIPCNVMDFHDNYYYNLVITQELFNHKSRHHFFRTIHRKLYKWYYCREAHLYMVGDIPHVFPEPRPTSRRRRPCRSVLYAAAVI